MADNEQLSKQILSFMEGVSLRDKVEVLANVLMFLGTSHMDVTESITPENIAAIVLKDRESNGETIANALTLQGLTMMLWLNTK